MWEKTKRKSETAHPVLPIWLLLLLTLTVLTVGGVGTAAAKYLHGSEGATMTIAPKFYFTSDLLTTDNRSYVLNSGVDEVEFTLSDKADDFRDSELPVSYKIEVTNDGKLSDSTGEFDHVDKVNIKLSGMIPGKIYEVTATGTGGGYTKVLKATFKVTDQDENVYKHLEVSPDGYMILTVWTHNVEGKANVEFPGALIPDNTNKDMETVYNHDDTEFTSNFEKYASQTYRFFYTQGNINGIEDFDVTVTDSESKVYTAEASELPEVQ